jgi:hypothetical protein
MAATLFGLTVGGDHRRRDAGSGARALGSSATIGTLERGKWCDLAIWDIERPAELVYRIGFNPLHRARAERRMTSRCSRARARSPTGARCRRRRVAARSAALPAIEASARTVDAIVARGEPVYGINTGFGKLASVRIGPRSRDAPTQHRAVARRRRRRADAGANVRLMMALKLASLGQAPPACGRRPSPC